MRALALAFSVDGYPVKVWHVADAEAVEVVVWARRRGSSLTVLLSWARIRSASVPLFTAT